MVTVPLGIKCNVKQGVAKTVPQPKDRAAVLKALAMWFRNIIIQAPGIAQESHLKKLSNHIKLRILHLGDESGADFSRKTVKMK